MSQLLDDNPTGQSPGPGPVVAGVVSAVAMPAGVGVTPGLVVSTIDASAVAPGLIAMPADIALDAQPRGQSMKRAREGEAPLGSPLGGGAADGGAVAAPRGLVRQATDLQRAHARRAAGRGGGGGPGPGR